MQQQPAKVSNHKQAAIAFCQLAASGKVREAYSRHVGPNFRHHNPHFAGDAESLMVPMEENARENPDKVLEVKHALEEGDLVAVHSRVRLKPTERDIALVHIFKFEGDRIAELWDIGQPEPENSPNQYGMF